MNVLNKSKNLNKILFEKALLESTSLSGLSPLFDRVLIDAGWNNPNFWIRFAMLRSALNLANSTTFGLLGDSQQNEQKKSLNRFGIYNIYKSNRISFMTMIKNFFLARKITLSLKSADDILQLTLPLNSPPSFLYDYILKKQSAPYVDIAHNKLFKHIFSYLNLFSFSIKILKTTKPSLIITSHTIGRYFPLVWTSLKNNIPIIVPFGDSGLLKYWKLNSIHEIYDFMDALKFGDYKKSIPEKKYALQKAGLNYLQKRTKGQVDNLGAIYAYNLPTRMISKDSICKLFNWDPNKKIVAIYGANWFDYPHLFGMSHFRDFYDWMMQTVMHANQIKSVNWLLKPHPVDKKYGGVSLASIVELKLNSHIKLTDENWNGNALIDIIDAFVTYHGTIGIEAAARFKPVLLADKGWYHDWGFALSPNSKKEYLELLNTDWWNKMNLSENQKKAAALAGAFWSRPDWQENFLLDDDSKQWEIYVSALKLLDLNKKIIQHEILNIRNWLNANTSHYHTFKVLQAKKYIT